MTILNGNVLLANFVGKAINEITLKEFGNLAPIDRLFYNKTFAEDLEYHTNWNDLMTVVDFIENIEDGNRCAKFNVNITQTFVDITDNENSEEIINLDRDSKLKAVYDAVVEFVVWFNKQS